MADIELVMKIDEEQYKFITQELTMYEVKDYHALLWDICERIKNSTPLPKGHERLIDELDLDLFAPSLGTDEYVNDLMAKHNIDYVNGDDEDKVRAFATDLIHGCMNVIKTAPTIIEADKEKRDADSN